MRTRLALAAVLAAGCGGDALSREEFVTRGEAICVEAQRDLASLERQALPPDEAGPRAARISERQVDALTGLEPPESLVPQAARLEEVVGEVRDLSRRAAAGDDPEEALEAIQRKGTEAERLLVELGLGRCADDANVDP